LACSFWNSIAQNGGAVSAVSAGRTRPVAANLPLLASAVTAAASQLTSWLQNNVFKQ